MHGTTATIRPCHASRNFAAITKFLTRKLKISQILSVSRNFCALKIWSYTVYIITQYVYTCSKLMAILNLAIRRQASQKFLALRYDVFLNQVM